MEALGMLFAPRPLEDFEQDDIADQNIGAASNGRVQFCDSLGINSTDACDPD